jgi:hypothetical protein
MTKKEGGEDTPAVVSGGSKTTSDSVVVVSMGEVKLRRGAVGETKRKTR